MRPATTRIDFLCVGLANYDLTVTVDAFPAENSKCEVRDLLECGGGPAANAACLLARWGARCAFAGAIGDDHYGRRLRKEFDEAGVDTSLLAIQPGSATPVSFVWVNRGNGSRTIVNRRIPGTPLDLDPKRSEALEPGYLLFDGHELPAARQALARWPGAISLLDAGSWRPGTAELAAEVDFLVASERFAGQATDSVLFSTLEGALAGVQVLRARYGASTVVTLGERGLVADDGSAGGPKNLAAFPATARDTTGAGDIFHGAFAFGLHRGGGFWDSLRLASMAAALSVAVAGGRTSIPSLEKVEGALAYAG